MTLFFEKAIKPVWQGNWNSTSNYQKDDIVFWEKSSWIAKRSNRNITPLEGDDWSILTIPATQLSNKGEMLTHDGEKPTKLTIGSEGEILKSLGGVKKWGTRTDTFLINTPPPIRSPIV